MTMELVHVREEYFLLREDIESILQFGTTEEKQILELTLKAIKRKKDRGTAYMSGFLNLEGEFVDEQTYQFVLPITPFMMNNLNIVHGGITATLADSTMGSLISESLPDNLTVVTSEMKVNYIGPGKGNELISKATLVSLGNQLCVAECRIENDQGRLIAIATGTFFIIKKRKKW